MAIPVHSAESILESPSAGSVELFVNGQAPLAGDQKLVGHFPTPTVVAMTVHQQFTLTAVPPFAPNTGELGLAGRISGFGCSGQGSAYLLNYPDEGGYSFSFMGCQLAHDSLITSYSDTVAVNGTVLYGYDYDAACVFPDVQCARYSGSSGTALTRVPATLAIGGDSVRGATLRAFPQRQYVLEALATPSMMGRYATPMLPVETGWTFTPDSGAAESNVCNNGSARSCVKTFQKSGDLTLVALVNGVLTTSPPLRVQLPELRLALSAESAAAGDTVIATTTVLGIDTTALSFYSVSTDGVYATPVAGMGPRADGLLPCLGTKPVPTHCYFVLARPGNALVEVGAFLDRYGLATWAQRVVKVTGSSAAATIDIIAAAGPNVGGSFTTRAPENRITLEARVTPASLASQVTWSVVDLAGDGVESVALAAPPTAGAASSFIVPVANASEERWPTTHPGALNQKSLAYSVTASVVHQGKTYTTKPVTIRQDEYDTVRQEYIDFDKVYLPSRAELGASGDPKRNSGDYGVWPSSPRLVEKLPILQSLAAQRFGHPLSITGGFRNPVHHHVHRSLTTRESQHLYGAAVDFSVGDAPGGMSVVQYFTIARDLAVSPAVRGCFEPEDAIRSGNQPTHTVNHIHVDWRGKCPPGWGART